MLMKEDLEKAYKIHGAHPEYIRGNLMKKTVGRVPVDLLLCSTEKRHVIHVNVILVDSKKFLISVSDPLNLMKQMEVEREDREVIGLAPQGHLSVFHSRDFMPTIVYVDPHSTFKSITQDYHGIEIDVGGVGDYVVKVDAKIC